MCGGWVVGAVTAVVVPVAAVVLLALVCFIVVLVVLIKRRGNKSDDWEIEYSELEVGETLGAGGYGLTLFSFSFSFSFLVGFPCLPPPMAGRPRFVARRS